MALKNNGTCYGAFTLIALEVERKKYNNVYEFVLHRINKYFPHLFFSYIVILIVLSWYNRWGIIESLYQGVFNIDELLFLKAITFYSGIGLNGATWYLSSLIICGSVIFYLLKNNKKIYIEIMAPFGTILIYAFLLNEKGGLNHGLYKDVTMWDALMRSYAAMSIGCVIYYLQQYFENIKYSQWVSIISNVSFIIAIIITADSNYVEIQGFLALILIIVGVFFSKYIILSGYIGDFIGNFEKYTYAIFLNHCAVRLIIFRFFKYGIVTVLIYLIVISIYSVFTYVIVEKICKIIKGHLIRC